MSEKTITREIIETILHMHNGGRNPSYMLVSEFEEWVTERDRKLAALKDYLDHGEVVKECR